jgi:hypothetical protein
MRSVKRSRPHVITTIAKRTSIKWLLGVNALPKELQTRELRTLKAGGMGF